MDGNKTPQQNTKNNNYYIWQSIYYYTNMINYCTQMLNQCYQALEHDEYDEYSDDDNTQNNVNFEDIVTDHLRQQQQAANSNQPNKIKTKTAAGQSKENGQQKAKNDVGNGQKRPGNNGLTKISNGPKKNTFAANSVKFSKSSKGNGLKSSQKSQKTMNDDSGIQFTSKSFANTSNLNNPAKKLKVLSKPAKAQTTEKVVNNANLIRIDSSSSDSDDNIIITQIEHTPNQVIQTVENSDIEEQKKDELVFEQNEDQAGNEQHFSNRLNNIETYSDSM